MCCLWPLKSPCCSGHPGVQGPRVWVPVARDTVLWEEWELRVQALEKSFSHGIWSCWCSELILNLLSRRKAGELADQASPLPFRFPDTAGWLNVAFSCAAWNEAVWFFPPEQWLFLWVLASPRQCPTQWSLFFSICLSWWTLWTLSGWLLSDVYS